MYCVSMDLPLGCFETADEQLDVVVENLVNIQTANLCLDATLTSPAGPDVVLRFSNNYGTGSSSFGAPTTFTVSLYVFHCCMYT